MTEKIKLALALLLVAAGLGAFYLLAEHAMVLRVLAVLVGIGAAVAIMLTTTMGQAAFAFSREALAEARKVVWPTRKETIQTTVAVFALVVVMGIFLWVVDAALLWGVQFLMGRS
ncbi:MAG: preprotein translocase subunit SecE [Methylophilaceae bacterium]|jgi:preprotein translocase subunit SecE